MLVSAFRVVSYKNSPKINKLSSSDQNYYLKYRSDNLKNIP